MLASSVYSGYLEAPRGKNFYWPEQDECVRAKKLSYLDLVKQRIRVRQEHLRHLSLLKFMVKWIIMMVPPDDVSPGKQWKIFLRARMAFVLYCNAKIVLTMLFGDTLIPMYGDVGQGYGHLRDILNLALVGASLFVHWANARSERVFDWAFYNTLLSALSTDYDDTILKTPVTGNTFARETVANGTGLSRLVNWSGQFATSSSHSPLDRHFVAAQDSSSAYSSANAHAHAHTHSHNNSTMIQLDRVSFSHAARRMSLMPAILAVGHNGQRLMPDALTGAMGPPATTRGATRNPSGSFGWQQLSKLQLDQTLRMCKFEGLHRVYYRKVKRTLFIMVAIALILLGHHIHHYLAIQRAQMVRLHPGLSQTLLLVYQLEYALLSLDIVFLSLALAFIYLISAEHAIELSDKLLVQLRSCASDCLDLFDGIYIRPLLELDAGLRPRPSIKPARYRPEDYHRHYERLSWLLVALQNYSHHLTARSKAWTMILSGTVVIVNVIFISTTWRLSLIMPELRSDSEATKQFLVACIPGGLFYMALTMICAKAGEIYDKFEKFESPLSTIEALLPAFGHYGELKTLISIGGSTWKRRARSNILGILPLSKMTMFLALSWSGSVILAMRQGLVYM